MPASLLKYVVLVNWVASSSVERFPDKKEALSSTLRRPTRNIICILDKLKQLSENMLRHMMIVGLRTLLLAALLWSIFFLPSQAKAQSNNMFIITSPAEIFKAGSTVTISVDISTSEKINAVQAYLSYPADKLKFANIDTKNSSFSVIAKGAGGNGNVTITQGSTSPVQGDLKLAKISFVALKEVSSTEIKLVSPSLIASSTTNSNIFQGNTQYKTAGIQATKEVKTDVPVEYLSPSPSQTTNVTSEPEKVTFLSLVKSFILSLFKK